MNSYQILNLLGEGTFSSVYLVKRISDAKLFAMKKIDLLNATTKQRQNALNQIRLLSSIQSQYIIGYETAFYHSDDESLCIIMQYAENSDISKKIENAKRQNKLIPEIEIWKIIYHCAKGINSQNNLALKCLHFNNIIHRDLKTANIFENAQHVFKIGDFNISKLLKQENQLTKTQVGTPFYASPQVWKNQYYDTRTDIWSLGVIAYQLCTLTLPFQAVDNNELYEKIQHGTYQKISNEYSRELINLINAMLSLNSAERPSPQQIIRYYIFNKSKTSKVMNVKIINKKNKLLDPIILPEKLEQLDSIIIKHQENYQHEKYGNLMKSTNLSRRDGDLSYHHNNNISVQYTKNPTINQNKNLQKRLLNINKQHFHNSFLIVKKQGVENRIKKKSITLKLPKVKRQY